MFKSFRKKEEVVGRLIQVAEIVVDRWNFRETTIVLVEEDGTRTPIPASKITEGCQIRVGDTVQLIVIGDEKDPMKYVV